MIEIRVRDAKYQQTDNKKLAASAGSIRGKAKRTA
jgi:hypothetical protein